MNETVEISGAPEVGSNGQVTVMYLLYVTDVTGRLILRVLPTGVVEYGYQVDPSVWRFK